MKKLLIIPMVLIFVSPALSQDFFQFRWQSETREDWKPNDSNQTHFGWNGWAVYSFAKNKTDSKLKGVLWAAGLGIGKELWDSVIPQEKAWIFGGAGGEFSDIGYTFAGITFGIGMDYLIPQTKKFCRKIPIIRKVVPS